jgi:hypothetical protein
MNKIAIGLALAIGLLVGCSKSPQNENGAFVGNRVGTNEWCVSMNSGGGVWTFRYAIVDGHEYLIMSGCHISGLTHSPKCVCHTNTVNSVSTP